MNALYLDDIRIPIEIPNNVSQWDIVRNFDEFKNAIYNKHYDLISFDNDLATDPIDGCYITDWLLNYCVENNIILNSTITIHSDNNVAVDNMLSKFRTYKKIFKTNLNVYQFQWKHMI